MSACKKPTNTGLRSSNSLLISLKCSLLILDRYPHIVEDVIEEEAQTVNGVVIPIDTSQPNPNQTEFDNLYLVRHCKPVLLLIVILANCAQ